MELLPPETLAVITAHLSDIDIYMLECALFTTQPPPPGIAETASAEQWCWLQANEIVLDDAAIIPAVKYGWHTFATSIAATVSFKYGTKASAAASDLEILQMMHSAGTPIDSLTAINAARYGRTKIIRWIIDNRARRELLLCGASLIAAIKHHNNDIADIILNNMTLPCLSAAINAAITYENVTAMKTMLSWFKNISPAQAMAIVKLCARGDTRFIEFMTTRPQDYCVMMECLQLHGDSAMIARWGRYNIQPSCKLTRLVTAETLSSAISAGYVPVFNDLAICYTAKWYDSVKLLLTRGIEPTDTMISHMLQHNQRDLLRILPQKAKIIAVKQGNLPMLEWLDTILPGVVDVLPKCKRGSMMLLKQILSHEFDVKRIYTSAIHSGPDSLDMIAESHPLPKYRIWTYLANIAVKYPKHADNGIMPSAKWVLARYGPPEDAWVTRRIKSCAIEFCPAAVSMFISLGLITVSRVIELCHICDWRWHEYLRLTHPGM